MDVKKEKMAMALSKYDGNISAACKEVGINRSTYYDWIEKDPDFVQRVQEVEESVIDAVEQKLQELIQKENNVTATIFFLKTKGKKRGYTEDAASSNQEIKIKEIKIVK